MCILILSPFSEACSLMKSDDPPVESTPLLMLNSPLEKFREFDESLPNFS